MLENIKESELNIYACYHLNTTEQIFHKNVKLNVSLELVCRYKCMYNILHRFYKCQISQTRRFSSSTSEAISNQCLF